jgi:hypothetical protein
MIKDILLRLNEYTEEPDAFETESERVMQKELEDKLDQEHLNDEKQQRIEFFKKRNAHLNNIYKMLCKFKFIRNLDMLKDPNDKRYNYIQFWIPENKLSYMSKFSFNGLNVTKYNSSEGYIVNIQ